MSHPEEVLEYLKWERDLLRQQVINELEKLKKTINEIQDKLNNGRID
jgi:hypothetical protein